MTQSTRRSADDGDRKAPVILVATRDTVVRLLPGDDVLRPVEGMDEQSPTCLATTPGGGEAAWCGTSDAGVYRSDDGGMVWRPAGLDGEHITALRADPTREGIVWAGTEPSAVWRGSWDPVGEADVKWERREGLLELPSSVDWSFPPRPETHHVRWIACHPVEGGRLWVAIEAGALIWTEDGGATWHDRVEGSPRDTHELAIHPERPDLLRIAAGDGYFESFDGGRRWRAPMDGLEVGYLRSVAVSPDDPHTIVVSAASKARSAYAAFRADGRLYRREGNAAWTRVLQGWPEPPETIAPLLFADAPRGRILAADERGVHESVDGGVRWTRLGRFVDAPAWLRGLAVL
ncbi:MAG: hypothetical protein R3304_12380 [Longimicrobiales bacterium]|nr:hypothetical protein [Longimicrobiales bacterium]